MWKTRGTTAKSYATIKYKMRFLTSFGMTVTGLRIVDEISHFVRNDGWGEISHFVRNDGWGEIPHFVRNDGYKTYRHFEGGTTEKSQATIKYKRDSSPRWE